MSDVFISYARSTEAEARRITDALRASGYAVWMDDQLPAHRAYGDVIEERLATAKAVLVVWSDEAVKSQWVRSEANRAREEAKLVQLSLDGARLPMPFDQIQCADLVGWHGDLAAPGWRKVMASIAELAGAASEGGAQPKEAAATEAPAPPSSQAAARAQRRGNLPLQPTALVGRERHLNELAGLLSGHRLVTLTGVGGVGKTRLAVQVASTAAAEHADGACMVDFAALRDAAATGHAVAAALGAAQQPGMSIEQSVVQWLGARELVLVLDNCEHLLEAIADLAYEIIAHCPGVTLIATSREALMLDGERIWPVPSLGFREGADSAAVALFVARARAVVPGFELGDDAGAITEICRRLDGIPLAIELAAARVRAMSPQQIRDRLEDSFRLLTGGSRRALERHQSLRQTVQWSIDLLTPQERQLLIRTTVFAGEFALEAAESVCTGGEIETFEVLDLLDSLVRKSLVQAVRTEHAVRYRLLETIRQFGEEMLVAGGDIDLWRHRHARHFANEAVTNFGVWRSPRQREAYLWLGREMDNLRVAFGWAWEHDDVDIAATLAAHIGDMARLYMRDEPRQWPGLVVDAARVARHRSLALILNWQCSNAWGEGRMDDAVRAGEEAIALLADPHFQPIAQMYADLAYIAVMRGEVTKGLAYITAGAQHPDDAVDRLCLAVLPYVQRAAGDVDGAIRASAQGLPLIEAAGVPSSIAFAWWSRAEALAARDPESARAAAKEAIDLARASGNHFWELLFWRTRAALEASSGDPYDALSNMLEPLVLWRDSAEVVMVNQGLAALGLLLARTGQPMAAATLCGALADDVGIATVLPEYDGVMQEVRATLGEAGFAAALGDGAAMKLRAAIGYVEAQARAVLTDRAAKQARDAERTEDEAS